MKKRILGIVLCLVMILSLLPLSGVTALAVDPYPNYVTVGGVTIWNGDYIKGGTRYTSEQPGWTAYYKDGMLTLNNHQPPQRISHVSVLTMLRS